MPQLDHVTYFSQSFWLTVFFLSFYVILVKTLLPKVGTILKLRKKLTDPKNQSSQETSAESTLGAYDKILMNSLSESKSLISGTSASSQKWYQETVQTINQKNLSESQEQYVDTVGQLLAKKYILKSILSESK